MHNQRCIVYNTNEQLIKITPERQTILFGCLKMRQRGKESDIGGIKA